MKHHRNEITDADLAMWPEFDSSALGPGDRKIFAMRRLAIELYAEGETIKRIEDRTHVNRRQLYRLVAHCTDAHPDGRPFGFRALVRYMHVVSHCSSLHRLSILKICLYKPNGGDTFTFQGHRL